jgi:tetratricopeptide (TPR) repeat protein
MGVVYAAHDDELDRKIAIKLLKTNQLGGSEGRTRLLREAQALARLSHPNVVQVYEVGPHGEDVFIAMEFLRGKTLKKWLGQDRDRSEILDVVIGAGRGLAAAHAVGLVHRDFKPDNVMVEDDGRPRVLDFGLARPSDQLSEGEAAPIDLEASTRPSSRGLLGTPLTETGTMMGTPAYMSPEQFSAEPGDHRTDQFSFCVVLYEALYGARPFAGDSIKKLGFSVLRGQIRDPPPGKRVPSWLRDVVLRGLSVDAGARWPSMDALLDALLDDPARKRKRGLALVGMLGLAGSSALAGSLFLGGLAPKEPFSCPSADEALGELWGETRQARLKQRLFSSGVSRAQYRWDETKLALDLWEKNWRAQWPNVCEGAEFEDTQPQAAMRDCMTRQVQQFDVLLELLLELDPKYTASLPTAFRAQLFPEACSTPEGAAALPARRSREAARRGWRLNLERWTTGGAMGAQHPATDEIVEKARELGDPRFLANLLASQGEHEEAGLVAEAAGDDYELIAALAHQALLTNPINEGAMGPLIERMDNLMSGIRHVRSNDLLLRAKASRASRLADMSTAATLARQRLGLVTEYFGEASIERKSALENLAYAERQLGHDDEARNLYLQDLELRTRHFGADSLQAAWSHWGLGVIDRRMGRLDSAIAHHERALRISRGHEDHEAELQSLHHLSTTFLWAGRSEDAISGVREALEKAVEYETKGLALAKLRVRSASLLAVVGRYEEGIALAEQALSDINDRVPRFVSRQLAGMNVGTSALAQASLLLGKDSARALELSKSAYESLRYVKDAGGRPQDEFADGYKARAHAVYARALFVDEQPDEARRVAREGLELLEPPSVALSPPELAYREIWVQWLHQHAQAPAG